MSILIENLSTLQNVIYIISSMLFITGIKMLGKEDTAVRGNFLSALAMFIAVSITLVNVVDPFIIIIGISVGAIIGSVIALKVKMTSIPEMVELFSIHTYNVNNFYWWGDIYWKHCCLWKIV
jgi:NAD(P) transhydrogenase subunit beta